MKIFTDSGCDLPKSFYEEQNVTLFPLRVHLNGQEYDDVYGIEPAEIYKAIAAGAQPKTSQVSPEVFYEAFEQIAQNNEEAIYIAFSSQLSGTCQTAMMIRNELLETYPNLKLAIIDTKCASLGHGFVVTEAVRLRDAEKSFDEIVTSISTYTHSIEHLFTVADLDYLAKGGRVSKTSAFVGGLLSIKPILNVEDGKLIPLEKVRGHKKAINRMIDLMVERGGDFSNKVVGLSHSNDEQLLADVKRVIEERLQPKSIEVTTIGAVIGSHVGLGTIAIFFTK
ncbi:DegV family protein [Lysinibacillus sp. KU-BSD001]|uniref:DegV family protein n=1 Tax=Lysinibacillus sp. KU-BSD001 TaxID=3141328 RepID=UPI0036EBBE48